MTQRNIDFEDVKMAARHADRFIRGITERRHGFYVGITRDTDARWDRHHSKDSHWSHMTTLVEALNSEATSAVEMQILAKWGSDPYCCNRSSGGESPTPGSPHYVYVLETLTTSFPRRRVSEP